MYLVSLGGVWLESPDNGWNKEILPMRTNNRLLRMTSLELLENSFLPQMGQTITCAKQVSLSQ
jgi:hypothetical protein